MKLEGNRLIELLGLPVWDEIVGSGDEN